MRGGGGGGGLEGKAFDTRQANDCKELSGDASQPSCPHLLGSFSPMTTRFAVSSPVALLAARRWLCGRVCCAEPHKVTLCAFMSRITTSVHWVTPYSVVIFPFFRHQTKDGERDVR